MNTALKNGLLLSFAVISFFMHYNHFPKDLVSIHVWRQTQTQSTIDNFYEEDMNIFNPRRNDRGDTEGLFRMEFPLAQWLVALAYKLFGPNLIISRLMMFLFGLFSMLGIYRLLRVLFGKEILALMGAWAFTFSPSFFYYTINPLPDNLALCCGIWGLVFFFSWQNSQKTIHLILSGLMIGLAALCKLPFILYFVVPGYFYISKMMRQGITGKVVARAAIPLSFILLPITWYIAVLPGWSDNIIVKGMLDNRESTGRLLDIIQHNLVSTLPELLLNYGSVLFFLAGFYFLYRRKAFLDKRFPLILALGLAILVYFFFELNAIEKIHDYYLFPFMPLLFMLVGYGAFHLHSSKLVFFRYLTVLLLIGLPLTCSLRMQSRWDVESPGFNRDLLIHKTELQNAVPDSALVVAGNDESHFIFFYYIGKKGWGFHADELTGEQLAGMIGKGAAYLYSDSRAVEENPSVAKHLGDLVMEKGSLRVFRLRSSGSETRGDQ
jgi:hypothetical protein